jgi:hypothetical protein
MSDFGASSTPLCEHYALISRHALGRRIIAPILIALFSITLAIEPASACSCARNRTADRLLNYSTAVFVGIAQRSITVRPGFLITTFKVTESFKGTKAGATVTVRHRRLSTGSCGINFKDGESYTLAARRSDNSRHLSTSRCSAWMSNTRFTTKIVTELRAARQPHATPPAISPPPARGAGRTPDPGDLKDLETLD